MVGEMHLVRRLFAVALPTAISFGSLAACSLTPLGSPAPSSAPVTPGLGLACAVDAQCASHRCSADIVSGSCGVCVDPRKLGERCDGPLQGCNPSAICDQGICKSTKKTVGEACALGAKGGDRRECDDELFCSRIDGAEEPMCLPLILIPVGEPCNFEPWAGLCTGGAYCSADVGGICVLPVSTSCNSTSCGVGNYCSNDGRCTPEIHPLGAPCDIVNGKIVGGECVAGTVCYGHHVPQPDGGTQWLTACVPLPLQGELCIRDRCATGLFCARQAAESDPVHGEVTRCEVVRNEGEACTTLLYFNITCAAGLECRGEVCMQPCR